MKKWLVKILARMGWWRLAYRISPSVAGYYAAVGVSEGLQHGISDSLRREEG